MGKLSGRDRQIVERVVAARKDAGLSQGDVAVGLRISERGYAHYEQGRSALTVAQIFRLSSILARPVIWLLGIESGDGLTDQEQQLLFYFRALNEESWRSVVLTTARTGYKSLQGREP